MKFPTADGKELLLLAEIFPKGRGEFHRVNTVKGDLPYSKSAIEIN